MTYGLALVVATIRVGSDFVTPSTSVRDLGIFLDSDASMRTHVRRTVSSYFSALRQLRSVRRSVPVDTFQQLVVFSVLFRLDYGNATRDGLPAELPQQLLFVLNASARFIFGARKYDHFTTLTKSIQWLRFPKRIINKVAVLTFQCLHGTAPKYLSADLHRVADVPSRSLLRSANTSELVVPRTRLSTIGDHAFPAAVSRIWNGLPSDVTSAKTLRTFKDKLKPHLFRLSYS
jgi:hypothetical protein